MSNEQHTLNMTSPAPYLVSSGAAHVATTLLTTGMDNSSIPFQIYPNLRSIHLSAKSLFTAAHKHLEEIITNNTQEPECRDDVVELSPLEYQHVMDSGRMINAVEEMGTIIVRVGVNSLLAWAGMDPHPAIGATIAGFLRYPLHAYRVHLIQGECQGQLRSSGVKLFNVTGALICAAANGIETLLYNDLLLPLLYHPLEYSVSHMGATRMAPRIADAVARGASCAGVVPLYTLFRMIAARDNYRVYLEENGTEEEKEDEKETWGDGDIRSIVREYARENRLGSLWNGMGFMVPTAMTKAILAPIFTAVVLAAHPLEVQQT